MMAYIRNYIGLKVTMMTNDQDVHLNKSSSVVPSAKVISEKVDSYK